VSCRTQLPDVSTQPGRSRSCVNQRGCLFILVAFPVCDWSSRHSSSVCLAGSKGVLLHRANPTDLHRPCGAVDAPIVPKHSGIKPLSDSTADASLRSSAGFEAATCRLSVGCSTIELASYETCASCGVVIFWNTLCHTPPVFLLRSHTELQDFRSSARPGLSTQPNAVPSPRVLPAGLCLQSSNRRIALVPSLSLFGVSAVLGATVSGSLHRWPRLPVHSSFQNSSFRLVSK
jgi:hypothetical protein